MTSLLVVLDLAKKSISSKSFGQVPSLLLIPQHLSTTPKTMMEPSTVYGMTTIGRVLVSILSRKLWRRCEKLALPNVISWKTKPGGGTTDYAVDIFFMPSKPNPMSALKPSTQLPMMYMDDAVDATIKIMQANVKHTNKNLVNISMDFTPEELARNSETHPKVYVMSSRFRQAIADSWPQTIDDSPLEDWNWVNAISPLTKDIIKNLQTQRILNATLYKLISSRAYSLNVNKNMHQKVLNPFKFQPFQQ